MPLQDVDLARRQGGAENGHRILNSVLVEGEKIKVAFHNDDSVSFPDGLLRAVEPVEHRSLVVQEGLGGVHVLGFLLPEGAPAKGEYLAHGVEDREHEPIAESVVGTVSHLSSG